MTNSAKPLLCLLSIPVFWAGERTAFADTVGATPYHAIVERNVFGLKPPTPPSDPEANKPPPPKILLQGITTLLGNKRALLKVSVPAKPPEPAKEIPLVLAEGQRDGDIEVLAIDENARTVKVNDYGTVVDLNFDSNGVKTAASPVPGPPPHAPGFNPAAVANPSAPAAPGTLPTAHSPGRLPPMPGAGTVFGTTRAPGYTPSPGIIMGRSTAPRVALPGEGGSTPAIAPPLPPGVPSKYVPAQ
jgi:hypothetical protein